MKKPDRYFAFLLRLLPASFRDRHGRELGALLDRMKEDLGPSPSKITLLRLYLAVTWDLLWQSPLSRPEPSPGTREERGARGRKRTASTTLKIAAFAPIPRMSVTSATIM